MLIYNRYVFTSLSEAFGAADKVFELIDRTPAMLFEGKYEPPTCEGEITLENVVFSYPTRKDSRILDGLSLTIKPGTVVALVGPSGGGKSSIVNLIERLYDTEAGSVKLDGLELREYRPEYLHRVMSIVSQEPTLYARTIKENIIFGLEPGSTTDEGILLYGWCILTFDCSDTRGGEEGQCLRLHYGISRTV